MIKLVESSNFNMGGRNMAFNTKFEFEGLDLLYDAILNLETKEECDCFFNDLCTVQEIQKLCQRINVAFLLNQKVSYQIINDQTRASSATIGRVNTNLKFGSDGYKKIFKKLKNE